MNKITQGFATVSKVLCKESPFRLDPSDGKIYFNGDIFLVKTKTSIFGTKEIKFGESDNYLVSALNFAYKNGYEKNREILISHTTEKF